MCYLYGEPDVMHIILFLELLRSYARKLQWLLNEGVPEMKRIMSGLP